MIAGVFSFLSLASIGQQEHQHKPSWISSKGYWVVEGNIHSPLQHTIRFYNNDNLLIGIKELGGVKLDIKKRKVKMMLKESLESSLLAWEQKKTDHNQPIMATIKP